VLFVVVVVVSPNIIYAPFSIVAVARAAFL
jgi:hypothetical protein